MIRPVKLGQRSALEATEPFRPAPFSFGASISPRWIVGRLRPPPSSPACRARLPARSPAPWSSGSTTLIAPPSRPPHNRSPRRAPRLGRALEAAGRFRPTGCDNRLDTVGEITIRRPGRPAYYIMVEKCRAIFLCLSRLALRGEQISRIGMCSSQPSDFANGIRLLLANPAEAGISANSGTFSADGFFILVGYQFLPVVHSQHGRWAASAAPSFPHASHAAAEPPRPSRTPSSLKLGFLLLMNSAEAGISAGHGGTFPAAGFFILASYRIPTFVQHACGAASAAPSFPQTSHAEVEIGAGGTFPAACLRLLKGSFQSMGERRLRSPLLPSVRRPAHGSLTRAG